MNKLRFFGILMVCFTVLFVSCDFQANDEVVLNKQDEQNAVLQERSIHEEWQVDCELLCCSEYSYAGFRFSHESIRMFPGEELNLSFFVNNKDATINFNEIFVMVSEQGILSVQNVDENGLKLHALSSGETKVIAVYRGQSAECSVIIRKNQNISLSTYRIDMLYGETKSLTYQITPPSLGPVSTLLNTNAYVHMQHNAQDNKITFTAERIGETRLDIYYLGVKEEVVIIVHRNTIPEFTITPQQLDLKYSEDSMIIAFINNVPVDWQNQVRWIVNGKELSYITVGDTRGQVFKIDYKFRMLVRRGNINIVAQFAYPSFENPVYTAERVCKLYIERTPFGF